MLIKQEQQESPLLKFHQQTFNITQNIGHSQKFQQSLAGEIFEYMNKQN